MNIVQQTAGSIGTAVMSVVLTNQIENVAQATSPADALDISASAVGYDVHGGAHSHLADLRTSILPSAQQDRGARGCGYRDP
ncbi:hypothetical protein QMK32_15290 [Rhodococcus sp. H29-C3]|nr:hypothetical protein [Rhodococcus sp. H29-C3]MDJ0361600.1 hypothetical protein [Rhodococcus sp. H29-C3]